MIEQDASAFAQLQASKAVLGASGATLVNGDALAWLARQGEGATFDVAFLDPPFSDNLLQGALTLLSRGTLLAADGLIYVETAANHPLTPPGGWHIVREKTSGGVHCQLLRRD